MNRKILTVFAMLFASLMLTAQNKFPTTAEAQKFINTNAELHKEVEKKFGFSWDKLKVESDKWKGYNGTVFSLSYTQCGRDLEWVNWPHDAAFAKWIVTTPKNAKGIYKMGSIYIDYKRTIKEGKYCKLTDWHFNGYRVSEIMEYGFKEFTKDEIKNIITKEAKSGKIEVLNNFIEIKPFQEKDFGQNSPQPGQRYLFVYFTGTIGQFSIDHSIMYSSKEELLKLVLAIEKQGDEWVVTNSGLSQNTYPYKRLAELKENKGIVFNEETEEVNYETYETGGWDAVYGKKTPKPVGGMYIKLKDRADALSKMMVEKGFSLTNEDLKPYLRPSKADEQLSNLPAYTLDYGTKSYFYGGARFLKIESAELKGVYTATYISEDEEYMEVGLVQLRTKTNFYNKKGKKKWIEEQGSSYHGGSSQKDPGRNNKQVWVLEEGQWYLYDIASAFNYSNDASEAMKKYFNK